MFLSRVEAKGEVCLLGARIGGNLECDGASLSNPQGDALSAEGARIDGAFFLRPHKGTQTKITGALDLIGAKIGHINDAPESWPRPGQGTLALNRCVYGAFTGRGVTAKDRLDWLALQRPEEYGDDFWPQPYEQCAKVLREMGHPDDARDILIEKERQLRAARRAQAKAKWPTLANALLCDGMAARDWVFGTFVRYGQKPLRAAWWLAGLWLFGWLIFQTAWNQDHFKPNNAFILRAAEWYACAPDHAGEAARFDPAAHRSQLRCFLDQPEAQGLPQFNAPVYAFDVLFPLVQVEQQVHWIPDEDRWFAGMFAKFLVYVLIVAGWALSLLAVAGLSGLIKAD